MVGSQDGTTTAGDITIKEDQSAVNRVSKTTMGMFGGRLTK